MGTFSEKMGEGTENRYHVVDDSDSENAKKGLGKKVGMIGGLLKNVKR